MTNFIKGVAERLRFRILGVWRNSTTRTIVIGITIGLSILLIWWFAHPLLPWEQPMEPNITSSPSPNPIVNTDSTQSILITVTPAFKPPYVNDIEVTIQHDNPRTCYMVIEFETSDGFKFLPMSDNLPENFIVEEGYEYKDVMTVYIKDFPPEFDYCLIFSVYTMNPDTFGGTEQISWKVLEMHYED